MTLVWLVWVVYGYVNYDDMADRGQLSIVLLSAVIGMILLPIYFISVLLFYVYKRGPKKK
ncbi:hypothetical protein PAEVO_30470 [Paenibacillus sp. GM2FR]|nr:hypothetical protein PAEVO_30470 [Paenibacillus sp. GM2FR]